VTKTERERKKEIERELRVKVREGKIKVGGVVQSVNLYSKMCMCWVPLAV
jgi:hypothetical protein